MSESFITKGGLWVVTHNVLSVAVVVLGPVFSGQWHQPASVAVGAVLFVAGGALGIAGVRALGANRTPYPQPLAQAQLVRTGVYRWVRHPLYGSLVLASLGWALLWQSAAALLVTPLLAAVLLAKSRREEEWLRLKFPEYADYSAATRRLIPWVF
ncbi:hypothetical protein LBMAG56_53430 [Verrucomicrobiota bacterium]|nr:hypothetical protein LBMAG56_53430 [Verrucomicrobiota bacterium]